MANNYYKNGVRSFIGVFFLIGLSTVAGTFPDVGYTPPPGWTGPIFQLSQDYPMTLPPAEANPWSQIDFHQNPQAYMEAVINYCYEGNIDVEFVVQNNPVRKWYHAPWLHVGPNAREFIHGLTTERTSRPNELSAVQSQSYRNFAVGFYNPPGGYTIGSVWAEPTNPNYDSVNFPEGTVSFKLLFTTATTNLVPFLTGSPEWLADINKSPVAADITNMVRLLQVDIAVKDSRSSCGGWVFGTFQFDASSPETNVWRKLVPVTLTWGNDPNLTTETYNAGQRPTECWVNPAASVVAYRTHAPTDLNPPAPTTLGWLGRGNGPVDNPVSACMSCHSTAQIKATSNMIPPASASDQQKLRWFRDLAPGEAFDSGSSSLDFSLQLGVGIQNEQKFGTSVAQLDGFSAAALMAKRQENISGHKKVPKQFEFSRDPEQ